VTSREWEEIIAGKEEDMLRAYRAFLELEEAMAIARKNWLDSVDMLAASRARAKESEGK
jgi:hypothetical protein